VFFRYLRVGVPSLQALIAAIDNGPCFRMQTNFRLLEEPEVVALSFFVRKQRTRRVDFSTTSCVCRVCRFFLPE
jgi:hypothetical protein